ncbi:MAG: hypothetical protein Fur002_24920 [Anaerolineales bacterium]
MKIFKYIALALLTFNIVGAAAAQSNSVSIIDAQIGLAGVCKPNMWFPVSLTVENTGADFDARVQIIYKGSGNGRFVYAADAALPSSSRKRFTFYARSTDMVKDFRAQVLDGSKIRAEKKLNVSCDDNPLLIGVWADDPAPYNILNGVQALTQKTRVEVMSAQDLPEAPQGWQALDALVIANADTGELSAAQKTSMQLWLARGGKILVVGGAQWQLTVVGLRDILPLYVNATRAIYDFGSLSEYARSVSPLEGDAPAAVGALRDGAILLAGDESLPLLIQNKIGAGSVYFLAADPAMQPLRGWAGMNKIYQHIFGFTPRQSEWNESIHYDYYASSAIAAIPELDLPSVFYICGWLTLYILAIGPLNFFILRWLKRPELSWATIPALVILFSAAAYIFGFAYRGGTPTLHRVSLLRAWDGVPVSYSDSFVGVYSPQRTTYSIQSQDDFLLLPASGQNLESGDDWLSLQKSDGVILPNALFDIGGMNVVAAEGSAASLDVRHDLRLELFGTSTPPRLSGTLTNGGIPLNNAFLALPGGWVFLGDLAPHQTLNVDESIFSAPAVNFDLYSALRDVGLDAYPSSDDVEMRRRSYFVQSILAQGAELRITPGFYLLGWTEDAALAAPVSLLNQDSKQVNETLYVQKLSPNVVAPADFFAIPSSLYEWQSSSGSLGTASISNDGYEILFQPSAPFLIQQPTFLSFDIQANQQPYDTSSTVYGMLRVYAWNYAGQGWEDISANLYSLPNAADYLGIDGELRLKLEAAANSYIQINAINFNVGGFQ